MSGLWVSEQRFAVGRSIWSHSEEIANSIAAVAVAAVVVVVVAAVAAVAVAVDEVAYASSSPVPCSLTEV
jgi:hypothetical protein